MFATAGTFSFVVGLLFDSLIWDCLTWDCLIRD